MQTIACQDIPILIWKHSAGFGLILSKSQGWTDNNVHTCVFGFLNNSCKYVLDCHGGCQVVVLLLECHSDGGAPLGVMCVRSEKTKYSKRRAIWVAGREAG